MAWHIERVGDGRSGKRAVSGCLIPAPPKKPQDHEKKTTSPPPTTEKKNGMAFFVSIAEITRQRTINEAREAGEAFVDVHVGFSSPILSSPFFFSLLFCRKPLGGGVFLRFEFLSSPYLFFFSSQKQNSLRPLGQHIHPLSRET